MNSKMVVGYDRLSKEDLEKENDYSKSINNQMLMIKKFAQKIGLKIDKEYIDDGYSGINFDRPSFEELIQDIIDGKISTIITKDMSRLGREMIETIYYITEFFPAYDVRYIAINDSYDSADLDRDQKHFNIVMQSVLNDRYVKDVSDKRKKTAQLKTSQGEFIGCKSPYGYKIVKKDGKRTLEIDEYAANIVKRIFVSIASGMSRKEVAEELNRDKIVPPMLYMKMTPSKKKIYYDDWSDSIIYRILRNKTYTGRLVKRKSIKNNYKDKKRNYIAIRDRETTDIMHPIIISDKLFNEANEKIKTLKRKEKNGYIDSYNGSFSGLVICGECGRVMTACRITKNGKVRYSFECTSVKNRVHCPNRSIYDTKLQSIVGDAIKDLINNYANGEQIANKVAKDLMQKKRFNTKIANLKNSIELHDTNIRNLYIKKTHEEISLEEFLEKKKIESEIRKQEENELKRLITENDIEIEKNDILDKYNKFINNEILLKDYIRDFIKEIVIYKDNTIQLSFKFGLGEPKKIKLY